MRYMVWASAHDEPIHDADHAVAQFAEQWAPWGPRFTMYFGPERTGDLDGLLDWPERTLRVDVDHEIGRAAIRWLPDETHGVDLEESGPIIAGLGSDPEPEEIPAELARVSVDKAHEVVREYVTTGEKPSCVRWEPV